MVFRPGRNNDQPNQMVEVWETLSLPKGRLSVDFRHHSGKWKRHLGSERAFVGHCPYFCVGWAMVIDLQPTDMIYREIKTSKMKLQVTVTKSNYLFID